MAQYLIRKGKLNYELAKFDDSADSIETYTIYNRKCSCPSRYSTCKHTKILAAWQQAEEPQGLVYDDKANVIGNVFT
jgi:hypothetical protein